MNGWVRIRSWHALRTYTRDGGGITRCGRRVVPPMERSVTLPLTDKSCETCTRLVLHDEQTPQPEDDTVPG